MILMNKWSLMVIVTVCLVVFGNLIGPKTPSDAEIVANHICHSAINPDNYKYKPNSKGELKYKTRMQNCTNKWEKSLNSDSIFLAKEKAAYGL